MDDIKKQKIKQSLNATRLKRVNQQCHVYSCKIQYNKLNNLQKQQLNMLFIEGKWFYNHVLNLHKNSLKFKDINTTNIKQVNHYNKDKQLLNTNLKYLGSSMKQSIIAQMNANQKSIISLIKKGYQQYGQLHYIKQLKSIDLKQYNITHKIIDNKVKIQSISGLLKVKGLKQIEGLEIANAKLIKATNKDYYLNITTYKQKQLLNNNGQNIGIDFGCSNSFTLSNGRIVNIKIEETEKLKRLSRKLKRQIKGSNNYYKTLDKLHKEYSNIEFIKRDNTNKLIHYLKQYQHIIIQDEQLSNWKQLGHGKAVQHSILGRVKAKLKKLDNTIILDRFIPTSKYCSNCNSIIKSLKVYDRQFKCSKCKYEQNRDINAALNMVRIYQLMKNLVPMGCREFKRADFLKFINPIYIS